VSSSLELFEVTVVHTVYRALRSTPELQAGFQATGVLTQASKTAFLLDERDLVLSRFVLDAEPRDGFGSLCERFSGKRSLYVFLQSNQENTA
jgi:hypothetical protein